MPANAQAPAEDAKPLVVLTTIEGHQVENVTRLVRAWFESNKTGFASVFPCRELRYRAIDPLSVIAFAINEGGKYDGKLIVTAPYKMTDFARAANTAHNANPAELATTSAADYGTVDVSRLLREVGPLISPYHFTRDTDFLRMRLC